jgi:hypothetical protein
MGVGLIWVAASICGAQAAPVQRVNNVTTPALRFVGLGAAAAPTSTSNPPPNASQTLPGITVVLNVPFTFENLDPQVKRAIVRCNLLAHPNSAHIAEEQLAIPLNGRASSGTAPVTFAPVNNRNVAIAKAYSCFLEVSNGTSTTYAIGDKGPPWARSQIGSVLIVKGTIP